MLESEKQPWQQLSQQQQRQLQQAVDLAETARAAAEAKLKQVLAEANEAAGELTNNCCLIDHVSNATKPGQLSWVTKHGTIVVTLHMSPNLTTSNLSDSWQHSNQLE